MMSSNELQFRRLLERLPVGAYTCDSQGHITYFNRHAEQLWGRAPQINDAADRFCGSFRLFDADGAPMSHSDCWMARALATGKEYHGREVLIERPDGGRINALAHASPLFDEQGAICGAVNILIDITAQKEAQRTLLSLKNDFLATLAHELRTPLAPISNSLHVLRLLAELSPDAERIREVMEAQVNQMVRLIDDLLEVSRVIRGKIELRKESVDLAAIIRDAVEANRPLMEESGNRLTISIHPQPILLEADPLRLTQAITNLLENAARFTPAGGSIWVTSRPENQEAVISVRDNGSGIDAEMLPRVFDMFAQGDRSNRGLGVGLALAKSLVELHGGSIGARSEGPGQGSEFVIRLPLPRSPMVAAPASHGRTQSTALPARKVLVVDDTRASAFVLDRLLKAMGQHVAAAHSAASALVSARAWRPDMVISDIAMPEMDGYELARQLRREPDLKDTVLVALTGYGQDSDREQAMEAGFDFHLVKPVSVEALHDMLAALPLSRRDGDRHSTAGSAARRDYVHSRRH
jgi:signal transduction histidine kinase/FixJ family two-component response regulator